MKDTARYGAPLPTCAELAKKLGVHFSSVTRAIHRKEIDVIRLGKAIRIPWAEWARLTGEDPREPQPGGDRSAL